jgi:hypothetical protein
VCDGELANRRTLSDSRNSDNFLGEGTQGARSTGGARPLSKAIQTLSKLNAHKFTTDRVAVGVDVLPLPVQNEGSEVIEEMIEREESLVAKA